MFDNTWKKCIFVFIVIFMIVLVGGALSINYLHDTIVDNNIHSVTVVVADKYYDAEANTYHYSVITNNNQTLDIADHGDSHGEELWQKVVIGEKYRFIVRDSELTDNSANIIQIHNTTE